MADWLRSLGNRPPFRPPVFDDDEKTRAARLTTLVSWAIMVVALLYGVARAFGGVGGEMVWLAVVLPLGVAGAGFLALVLVHRGSVKVASGLVVLSTWLALSLMAQYLGGVRDASYAGLLVVVVMAGLLMGGAASLIVVGLSLLVGWGLAEAEINGTLMVEADSPVEALLSFGALFLLAAGVVSAANAGFRGLLGRVRENERETRAQNWELQQMRASLEQRVAERTDDLDRRSRYLQTAAQVAYAAGEILDREQLMRTSVELIRSSFGLYYVGLFLVDAGSAEGEWAVLRAGTGEAGEKMVARGHRVQVGEGMVGWSIAHAQSRFAQHASEDQIRLSTPELPETRAEAALPLRSRGRVVGALTVQSAAADFFDEATVTVLQTMADLLAVALANAELFEENERAVQALRRAYGEVSAEAWQTLLASRGEWGYRYVDGVLRPIRGSAFADGERPEQKAEGALTIPLEVGEQSIGAITYRRRQGEGPWEEEDVTLLRALSNGLVQALESARLLQETQRQAIREQQIGQIAATLANAVDVEGMLRSAVQELGRLPGVLEASVHLDAGSLGDAQTVGVEPANGDERVGAGDGA